MNKREKLEKEIGRENKTLAEIRAACREKIKQKENKIAGLQYDLKHLKED